MTAIVVMAVSVLISAVVYKNDYAVKRDLQKMSEWPQLRNAVTAILSHYNDMEFAYLYENMVLDEKKADSSLQKFSDNFSKIRINTGRVKDARLLSCAYSGKSSYISKKNRVVYDVKYFLECEGKDSICQIRLIETDGRWYIDDFGIQYGLSDEQRKKIEYYTLLQKKMEL